MCKEIPSATHLLDIDTWSSLEDLCNVNAAIVECSRGEYLNNGSVTYTAFGQKLSPVSSVGRLTSSFQDLAGPLCSIRKSESHDLVEHGIFDLRDQLHPD